MITLNDYLHTFPFIAITRGVHPQEAVAIGTALIDEGFRVVETPLNSPDPLKSIELLSQYFPQTLIGAGTVLTPDQVKDVRSAGGSAIISPNCNTRVIEETKRQGMISIPGVVTPTEIMTAIEAGADGLKLFPMEMIQLTGFKAVKVIVPPGTMLIPVGGMNANNWQPYYAAGAAGFGLGSSLYHPGITAVEIRARARAFATSWSHYKADPPQP